MPLEGTTANNQQARKLLADAILTPSTQGHINAIGDSTVQQKMIVSYHHFLIFCLRAFCRSLICVKLWHAIQLPSKTPKESG
jgi:hypothetical protein